jgi:hypothetical protein
MRRLIIGTAVFLVATLALVGWGDAFESGEVAVVTKRGRFVIAVDVASTSDERAQGLQNRRQLAAGTGMLFDFEFPQPVSMWMRNTFIPLDMVFAAESGRVVNIARNTTPFSLRNIASAGPVRWVLELNAGAATRMGIAPGDRLELDH